jgi:hypothetical protein
MPFKPTSLPPATGAEPQPRDLRTGRPETQRRLLSCTPGLAWCSGNWHFNAARPSFPPERPGPATELPARGSGAEASLLLRPSGLGRARRQGRGSALEFVCPGIIRPTGSASCSFGPSFRALRSRGSGSMGKSTGREFGLGNSRTILTIVNGDQTALERVTRSVKMMRARRLALVRGSGSACR